MPRLVIHVKPNARHTSVELLSTGEYRVCVTASPVDGKANAAVLATLAEFFSVPKSRVTILRGAHGKKKLVEI